MTTLEPILSIRELVVSYGAIKALHGISMDVYEGEIVCVIGANGAGKSTLLNSVMGAVPIEKGEILFESKPLAKRSHKVVASGISMSASDCRLPF
jgi:branched-chain amino acid transport system ATP-binding protein